MPFCKIPVPDGWRLNYPHFIGPPTQLRCCYTFIAITSIIIFAISLGYYYEIDKDEKIEITPFAKTDSDWECKSIGTYNGEYTFADYTTIPNNLSNDASIGFIARVSYTDDDSFDPQQFILETNISTINITTYRVNPTPLFDEVDQYAVEIKWGMAPTIDECIDMLNDYSCSAESVPITQSIDNIKLYKFSFNETFLWKYESNFESPNLYNSSTSYDPLLKFYWVRSNNFYLAAADENLCDIIDDGIDNGALHWGNPDGTLAPMRVQCELINDEYCIINATNQFTFTKSDNPLPTNTRMERVRTSDKKGKHLLYLLLSETLGGNCAERWELVCNEYYDIAGYCDTVYAPPYSCTRLEAKSLWTVLSLSFASSELVFTILMIFIGCTFRLFSNPFHDEKESETKMMTEMAITKEQSQ